ncbi:MAG TPA: succinylglutamate desuccinylase/aspartoacylase family protein [Limnochordia bacterium]|jgi:hypothetical protein|nr:succinylglutamate desuccinylase/aspartoacylase family protein [Limnochordia bacterium]
MRKQSMFVTTALLILLLATSVSFAQGPVLHDVRHGYGVTSVGWLSDYHAPLKDTPADSRVYHLDSGNPGATVVILGGSHSNEIAGIAAATLIVERAVITAGRVIVIPYANSSGAISIDDWRPHIRTWSVETESGVRIFPYGDRRTNAAHQEPDPETYSHHPSGFELVGNEARNLNRAHPGKADGTLTQQLAYAYYKIITDEQADIAIDMHEAGVTSRLANMVIANPKNLDSAVMAVVDLEMQGIVMNVEQSSEEFRGLSHREWGDHTQAAAYLIETPNPAQTPEIDDADVDVVTDPVNSLAKRAATQLASIQAILTVHDEFYGESLIWEGLPSFNDLVENGLGAYLR